jgi:glycosyltransferase involved in cell wall biosynthesis
MKITIVLGAFLPVPPVMGGAVEKAWFALAQEFARKGHEVVQVSRAVPEFPREEVMAGVSHRRVRGFNTPGSLIWLKVLDLIYSTRVKTILPKADIVVTNTFWLPLLLRDSQRGHIYVHVARYPKGQTRFYGKAARLQAPSQAVADAVAQEAPKLAGRVAVVPYPMPASINQSQPSPAAARGKIILFVGRIHPEKGVDLLIDAFAGAANAVFADWKLVIIGPAQSKFGGGGEQYLDDLKRRARDAAVVFRGPIFDPVLLEEEYRSARIFVYPSLAERGESFGLAPLEAMSQGCAVLVSDLACFRDFISDNQTGFVFNHRMARPGEALREQLGRITDDPTLLASVADAGYRRSADYSVARVADQFLTDFNSIIRHSDAAKGSR